MTFPSANTLSVDFLDGEIMVSGVEELEEEVVDFPEEVEVNSELRISLLIEITAGCSKAECASREFCNAEFSMADSKCSSSDESRDISEEGRESWDIMAISLGDISREKLDENKGMGI